MHKHKPQLIAVDEGVGYYVCQECGAHGHKDWLMDEIHWTHVAA